MARIFSCACAILLGGFLLGCGSSNTVAAIVNGQVITTRELDQRMERLNPAARAALGNDRRRLLEEMVTETVLFQEARRRGLERDPEVKRLIMDLKRQILIGRLLDQVRGERSVQVSDQQVAQFYEANRSLFKEPETSRTSHILVGDEEAAKKALSRLNGGEPFAQVAQELSTDPSKAKGGDIGFFSKGQLIPEFEAAARDLKVGELSGVVKSPLGYHIILLTDRRPARDRPLEEVKEQIRRQLAAQGAQTQAQTFVQQLRNNAQILIREPSGSAASGAATQGASSPQSSSQ